MIINGTDTLSVPAQFGSVRSGKTLILDGDGLCYKASATAVRFNTVMRRAQEEILKWQYLVGVNSVQVHLTSSDCTKHHRFEVASVKEYQGTRTGTAKPVLLDACREGLLKPEWELEGVTVHLHSSIEADDAMMIQAYTLGDLGIIASEDKDLRMTPYPFYDHYIGLVYDSTTKGFVGTRVTPSGKAALTGHGPLFFWAQMLSGDKADNIQGIKKYFGKKCGDSTAVGILRDVESVHHAADLVIDGYQYIQQNVLAEGWLLWLKRSPFDNVVDYMHSLDLTDRHKRFLDRCGSTLWRNNGD